MATAAQPIPELPPEISQQMTPSPSPYSAFTGAAGPDMGDLATGPIGQLEKKIADLEKWLGDAVMLITHLDPESKPILLAIAQAGKELKQRVQRVKEQAVPPGQSPVNRAMAGANTPGPDQSIPIRPMS